MFYSSNMMLSFEMSGLYFSTPFKYQSMFEFPPLTGITPSGDLRLMLFFFSIKSNIVKFRVKNLRNQLSFFSDKNPEAIIDLPTYPRLTEGK